ncbi:hypothetical protein ACFW6S_13535 [Streptomyces sp. NPDC058740]|uniref:hypothetical protein n=1 Tax=Streptomyces sp. NPDC058740 TaxID=3346619 RepID=UPI0036B50F40
MELLPTNLNRVANASLGGVTAVVFAVYAAEATWAVGAVPLCLALAVRGWRAGVRCEPGRLVVRGYLWTRRIERARITRVTDFPAVRWTTPGGGKRWTPVLAFVATPEEPAGSRTRKRDSAARLRTWATGRRR